MNVIIKIGILGVLGVLLALQFKTGKTEYAVCIGVAISLLIFGYSFGLFQKVLSSLLTIRRVLGKGADYMTILLKVTGIAYLCEFCAGICKDAGFSTVADQIEIVGKLSVMLSGLPILLAVIEQIQSMG